MCFKLISTDRGRFQLSANFPQYPPSEIRIYHFFPLRSQSLHPITPPPSSVPKMQLLKIRFSLERDGVMHQLLQFSMYEAPDFLMPASAADRKFRSFQYPYRVRKSLIMHLFLLITSHHKKKKMKICGQIPWRFSVSFLQKKLPVFDMPFSISTFALKYIFPLFIIKIYLCISIGKYLNS